MLPIGTEVKVKIEGFDDTIIKFEGWIEGYGNLSKRPQSTPQFVYIVRAYLGEKTDSLGFISAVVVDPANVKVKR